MSNESNKKPAAKDDASSDSKSSAKETPKATPRVLDLGSLDLTVEKVEERISPSETNVFDK
jgi:hypothetical protein